MPSSAKLIQTAFPNAELVDGEAMMRRVRRIKLPEEVNAIRTSVRLTEHALAAAEAAFTLGITERQLTARFMEAMAEAGVTTPTSQDIAWVTSRDQIWARSSRDNPIAAGDLVAFDAGLLCDGYYGELGRTMSLGAADAGTALKQRWDELWDRLLVACRPGAPATGFLDAYEAAGVAPPPMPVVRGLGLGNDLPLVTNALPKTASDQTIEAGMVLALTAYVWQEGIGAIYGQEPVVINESGPSLLSVNPFRETKDAIR
jgi:Xaa-Pro aminopeptidase